MNKNTRSVSRLIAFIIFAFAIAIPGRAQLKGFGIGPYVESAWPVGDFKDAYKNGLGVGLSADIKLPGGLGVTGSAGYMHFSARNQPDGETADAINAIPLRVGLKFRPIPLIYFKAEVGSAHLSGGNGTAFIFSPGIGIRILGIDVQGKYETWYRDGHSSFWGLRAGINF